MLGGLATPKASFYDDHCLIRLSETLSKSRQRVNAMVPPVPPLKVGFGVGSAVGRSKLLSLGAWYMPLEWGESIKERYKEQSFGIGENKVLHPQLN